MSDADQLRATTMVEPALDHTAKFTSSELGTGDVDKGKTVHNRDGKSMMSKASEEDVKLPNNSSQTLSALSADGTGNLIDLNTPESCDTSKPILESKQENFNASSNRSTAMDSLENNLIDLRLTDDRKSPNNQSDMMVSHTESGYLTDSAHSSNTISRDRHESVGSESDKTPCRESVSSCNGLDTIRDSDSSDEKTLVGFDPFGFTDCDSVNKKSVDLADLDEIFSVNGTPSRPESLSLPRPLQQYESRPHSKSEAGRMLSDVERVCDRKRSQSSGFPIPRVKEGVNISEEGLSRSLPHGMIMKKGELIEFIADDLQEKIRRSSPLSKPGSSGLSSRTSSLRSINSLSSSASSTMATSFTSGMSRSPSSAFQQSPDSIPPIDPAAIEDLEIKSRLVADSLDLMMGNLRNNLHKMSAITVGCEEAYKTSVDVTCDAVDSSIKSMYALMAKCEELSLSMVPIYKLADQIKEIKRLLDRFESQLVDKT